jgi:hypothetical protein
MPALWRVVAMLGSRILRWANVSGLTLQKPAGGAAKLGQKWRLDSGVEALSPACRKAVLWFRLCTARGVPSGHSPRLTTNRHLGRSFLRKSLKKLEYDELAKSSPRGRKASSQRLRRALAQRSSTALSTGNVDNRQKAFLAVAYGRKVMLDREVARK